MSGVERNGDDAGQFLCGVVVGWTFWLYDRRRFAVFVEQLSDRVRRGLGIEVKDQAMLVFADGLQRKHLGPDFFFEIKYQSHYARAILSGTHLGYVGIVGLDFGEQAFELRIKINAFDFNDQAVGVFD